MVGGQDAEAVGPGAVVEHGGEEARVAGEGDFGVGENALLIRIGAE